MLIKLFLVFQVQFERLGCISIEHEHTNSVENHGNLVEPYKQRPCPVQACASEPLSRGLKVFAVHDGCDVLMTGIFPPYCLGWTLLKNALEDEEVQTPLTFIASQVSKRESSFPPICLHCVYICLLVCLTVCVGFFLCFGGTCGK